MTRSPGATSRGARRRASALVADGRAVGLRRREFETSAGTIVARVSPRTGETPTILLHGAAGSWTTWTPVLRAAIASGDPVRDVIALDLPGWGESGAAASDVDVPGLGRAVVEVADQLGYDRFVLVGHSLGGLLALEIAARAPGRTAEVLVISASGPAVLDAIRRPLRGGARLPGFAGMLLAMRVLSALRGAARPLLRGLDRVGLLRVLSAPLFSAPHAVDGSVLRALAEEIRPQSFVLAARAAAAYDESVWRGIRCPVRSVRGERDVFVHGRDARRLSAFVPQVTETVLPDAGHFAAVEQPSSIAAMFGAIGRP
ncbi:MULTISPECIES: alpha/beta fold hydrolase [unclassified Microbacterium]|uniref:alpha/beta fold hydrolase n=1 Tax=unclassified Microbacterium TaxID=2609290 RepID=UPI0020049734|nr:MULTISPECIES: alpha/beta hydrolase [unclassified Microbacterium]